MRRLRLSFYPKGLMDRVIFASWSVLFGLSLSRSGLNLLRWKKKDGNFRIWQHAVWCEIKFAMLIVSSAQCPKAKLLLSVFWPCSGDLLFYIWERERKREISLCRNNIAHPAGFEDRVLRLILLLLVSCSSHSGKIRQQWKQKSRHGTARHAMPHVHAYTQEWTSVKILSSEANERASGFSGGPLFFRDSQWDDY